jgi:diguanylate cyclase (GGDEF)-like protein
MPRLLTSREAFDDVARSLLNGGTPIRHAALIVGELDEFDALAKRVGNAAAESVAAQVGRLLVSLLRGDDVVLTQRDGRYLLLLPGNTSDEGRQVGERLAGAVRTYGMAVADRQIVDRLSISFGVSAYPDHGTTLNDLYGPGNAACARVASQGGDGAAVAPLAHHEVLHRPLSIDRFAGRAAELSTLVRLVDEAIARRPRVVAILGESGLGTATLLRQLESHVRYRGGTMITSTSPNASIPEPYAVWTGVLRGLHRLPDAPQRDWRELQKLVAAMGPRLPDEAAGSQHRLLDELRRFIADCSQVRPLIIVLDEMQWADNTSWEALEHIITQLDTERILFCLTCRNEREFAEAAERRQVLKRHSLYSEIILNRLTREEVKQWLWAAFHHQEIGREFLAFVYRHTEGNPFFLAQLVSALVDQGALWHSVSRWEWSPVSELRLPSGIESLLAQRISRFSVSTQAIFSTAAAIGRDFDVRLVVEAGAGSEAAVRLAMSEGVAAGFLRPKSERRAGGYGFIHERIPTVLLRSLSAEQLRDLHRRLGHALVARGDRLAGEIAVHYHAARATGLAYEYARKAALDAEHVYAISAARAYLDIAVHDAESPAELADVRVQLAHLSEIGGRYDEVEELCDLAIEWFQGQRDVKRSLAARTLRERARMELGQPARVTLAALEALLEEARSLGFDEEGVAITTLASLTHSRLGEGRKAERLATSAVEMAERLGKKSLLADALMRLGPSLAQDSPERSREVLTRALAIFESLGDIRGQARAQNSIAITMQYEGRFAEARAAYGQAMQAARAAGMQDLSGIAALNIGTLLQKQGDFPKASEMLAEALNLCSGVRNSGLQVVVLFNIAHCEREQGLWESALSSYATCSSLAERIGHGDIEIGARAGAGLCYLGLGQIDEAQQAAAEVQSRLNRRHEWFQNREVSELLLVRVEAETGRVDSAFHLLESAIERTDSGDVYAIVWLILNSGPALVELDPNRLRPIVERNLPKAAKLGYPDLQERLNQLLARASLGVA